MMTTVKEVLRPLLLFHHLCPIVAFRARGIVASSRLIIRAPAAGTAVQVLLVLLARPVETALLTSFVILITATALLTSFVTLTLAAVLALPALVLLFVALATFVLITLIDCH